MLDYKKEEQKATKMNVLALREQINSKKIDKNLKIKILNYCETYDLEYEFVLYKILIDDIFLYSFIKDPKRQTIHQGLAAKYIQEMLGVESFQMLPSSGCGALFIHNGVILTQAQILTASNKCKSIDFTWIFNGCKGKTLCYASHKYTKSEGGAQDNQYQDIKIYLDNARQYTGREFFFAICDGEYYSSEKSNEKCRIDQLNLHHSGERSLALSINDLSLYMTRNF